MVRIGFERNEPWLKKVFAIAFLSLVDGLEPIHIHDVNAERAERIAIVIQNRIFSNQSPSRRENGKRSLDALRTDGSAGPPADRHTTDAARLHSTQVCASEALMPGRRPWLCGPGPEVTPHSRRQGQGAGQTLLWPDAVREGRVRSFAFCT